MLCALSRDLAGAFGGLGRLYYRWEPSKKESLVSPQEISCSQYGGTNGASVGGPGRIPSQGSLPSVSTVGVLLL